MGINEVLQGINSLTSAVELRQVNAVAIAKLRSLQSMNNVLAKQSFCVGDKVKWQSSRKRRGEQFGSIIKLNKVRAVVKTSMDIEWTVPFAMLEKVL